MKLNKIFYTLLLGSSMLSCGTNKVKQVVEKASNVVYQTVDEDFMDKAVLPQDDFFMFSNGTWVKNNPVPSSESRWGSFNELDEANKRKLNDILQTASTSNASKGTQDQILGDYLKSERFGSGCKIWCSAASTGEDPVTIEDIYEPYLMQIGFIAKTPRGRILTRGGFEHLGIPYIERDARIGATGQMTLQDILDGEVRDRKGDQEA